MVRKTLAAWGLGVLVAVGVAASARAEDEFARSGCYVGAGAGIAMPTALERQLEDARVVAIPGKVGPDPRGFFILFPQADVDDSASVQGRVGCRGRYVGVEGQFEWIDGFDTKFATAAKGTPPDDIPATESKGSAQVWFLGGNLKLYPFAGRFQPYATVGLGYLRATGSVGNDIVPVRVNDWDFATRLGGGLEVYITRNIALTGDAAYVLPLSRALEDLEYLSFNGGLLYRF